ncbi:SPOR domain-containing protein [Porticoccaceae bacterium]|nr:SPOR domain-containing protein [Porticoccaceae bacterium]
MRFVLLYIAFLSLHASAETYYIDDLVIETSSDTSSSSCVSGSRHSILVTGSIGPDSTFAVGKLIDEREPCTDANGEVIFPIEVTLESGGGYLEDGYKLGKVFRDRGVTTIIPDNKMCASSCAVAFLGGKKRLLAAKGSILFHAPYLKQMQLEGKERITCDLPKEELQALNDYYSSMTSVEVGDRLFERTMWYCSAENGWTIKGSAAAELYGIATKSKAAYMLQVAIFSALKNADNFKNELSTNNYPSFTQLISTKGGELSYRVYVGPNNRKHMIQAYKAKIDDRYKTDAIVLVSKNGDIFNWSSWEVES